MSRRPDPRFNRGRIASGVNVGVFQGIFGALPVRSLMTTEPGMVSTSGSNVTSVRNQGTVALNWSPTGTVTLNAGGGPNGADSVKFGSTASALTNTHDRLGPTAQPYYRAAVVKVVNWVSGQRLLANGAGNNNNQAFVHSTGSPGLAGVNSSGGNPNYGMPLGEWVLIEQQFSGTNLITDIGQDYIKVRGLCIAGVNFGGVTQRTGQSMGRGTDVEIAFYIEVDGKPSMAQLTAFADEIEARFGSNVVRAPLNADSHLFLLEGQSNIESDGYTGAGPGFTHTTPLSVLVRTSPTGDRNTSPTLLRRTRTRQSTAPVGRGGPELQMMVDLAASSKQPAAIIKNAFGSSSMVEALASPIYPLVTAHIAEFAGELDAITKLFLVVDRGNTDATQGISQATARTRYNALFADRIALAKAQCPLLTNADIYIVSVEISIDIAIVAATLLVNNGRLDALGDQAALGYNTVNITTSDLPPTSGPHWDATQINTIGARIAAAVIPLW